MYLYSRQFKYTPVQEAVVEEPIIPPIADVIASSIIAPFVTKPATEDKGTTANLITDREAAGDVPGDNKDVKRLQDKVT